jgi:hypothetical protein
LSRRYFQVAALLDSGWSGEYGELALAIGLDPARCGRTIGRIVNAYARRHPEWPHERVYAKRTGRPAN